MRKLLSACIITKNEELNIRDCLTSIKNVVDEIVIVDTGSTDNTIEIAKEFNAKIIQTDWENDFAKARNLSLENSSSEFNLIIDADEKLTNPEAVLKTLYNVPDDIGGWLVEMTSYRTNKFNKIDIVSNSLLRLIRNDENIRFNGIIHEQVFDSIYKLGLKIGISDIKLSHKGYELTFEQLKAKQLRNYNLLLKAIELEPNNLYLLNHLGKTLTVLDKTDDALEVFKTVIDKSETVGSFTIDAYNQIALIYFAKKQFDQSINYAKKSIEILPGQPLSHFILGDAYLGSKQFDKAYYTFKEIFGLLEQDNILVKIIGQYHIPKEQLFFKMGEALSGLSIFDEALKSYENGLKINPTDIFCLLGIYNTMLKMKKYEIANEWLKEIRKIHPQNDYLLQLQLIEINNENDEKTKIISQKSNPEKQPLISLTMIVKNEAEFLHGCLESVVDIVDEIIIVDTGSTDSTISIAQEFTQNIYSYKWNDDFAAARNEALKWANGKWILYLDADERLNITDKNKFRNFIATIDENIGGINCLIESEHYKLDGSSETHRGGYPRLFRNLGYPKINFRGRVHEQISPSILEQGLSFINSDIKIIHLGYNRDRSEMEKKVHRNYRLLLQHVKEEPTNGYAWYQLGQTLAQMRLIDEAEKAINLAITCGNLSDSVLASASATLAQLTGNKKNFVEALKWANLSLEKAPNQVYALHLKAFALLYLKRFEEAESTFREVLIRMEKKQGIPQSGFDIEIPESIILKGLEKSINKDSSF
jgi:glycosyltransferase involved in cell wall biosynthesis